jgi:phosphatidylinositol 3,5-bisphosphate 5-phosphatase
MSTILKSLLIYEVNRLMEGVRRWIGANPTSSPPKARGKPAAKPQEKKSPASPELEPHSTEMIARRLLDPSVSEEEEAEYQGSVFLMH